MAAEEVLEIAFGEEPGGRWVLPVSIGS